MNVVTLNLVKIVLEAVLVNNGEMAGIFLSPVALTGYLDTPAYSLAFFSCVFFPLKNLRTLSFIDHAFIINKAAKNKTVTEVSI